ncbi:MAG: alpha-rhamnosidase, partial [Clostridia bacterium]|nr:alpha-rhamnosidase [Clostridia bacterium]
QWIWYNGDFELYHSMKLHSRREEYGVEYPCFWSLSAPYPTCSFAKAYHSDEEDTLRVVTRHKAYVTIDGRRLPVNQDFTVPAGDHAIRIVIIAQEGFPCIYINSKYLVTDGTWVCDHLAGGPVPVGTWDAYTSPEDDPTVFPFAYETIHPVKVVNTDEGKLYDFGREMFSVVRFDADPAATVRVVYGESKEEATEPAEALIRETVTGKAHYDLVPRAFRYICVKSDGAEPTNVIADYEYLPLTDRASFSCNRRDVKKIWDICAYTLHLNSREFYLDGVKRDRWCWSGDAFQSYMANRYLYFDPAITKRTLIALLGKPPYVQHVNTINDYSMYVIIGAYEHYYATDDRQFIEIYFERIKALYEFIISRLDEAGYMCARKGDWVFMDWSDMDKDGPLCAEQVLLWQTHRVMAQMAELLGLDSTRYQKAAAKLKNSIVRDYWREDRGAFVDSYTSGKENVTRHANIFAIMYDFVSPTRAKKIVRCVLENDEVNAITTPYFAFFELNVLCKMGKLRTAQKKIESYWGGMVALGATTIWEQFIPEHKGAEHYAMYGKPYGCSLCHAWGGGPIYLLGRYCVGVYPTSVGYETYAVQPDRGMYKHFEGKVPLPEGDEVSVKMDAHTCTVTTTRPGGTLILKGQQYEIPVGVPFTVNY